MLRVDLSSPAPVDFARFHAGLAIALACTLIACGANASEDDGAGDESGLGTTNAESSDGSGSSSDGSEDGTLLDVGGGGTTDTDTASDTGPELPDWLIHVSDDKLWHIPIDTGQAVDICDLIPEEGVVLPSFQSVTFTREDRLIVSSGGDKSLWEIFLPSCEIVKLGDIVPSQSFPGVCPDAGNGLYGLTPVTDELYSLDLSTATGTLVGALGVDFGNTGGTWVEEEQNVYGITDHGDVDGLYLVDKDTGVATLVANLTENFGSVGMEYHPHDGQIYACTNPEVSGYASAPLFRVALDGTTTLIAETGLPGNCDNLGAPWGEPELPPID